MNCQPVDVGAVCKEWEIDGAHADEVRTLFEVWKADERCRPLVGWRAEVSYALDVVTGKARELGQGISREERDAMRGPNEIACTLDIVTFDGPRFRVIDWKTGRQEHMADTADHEQLLFGGLCVSLVTGVEEGILELAHITPEGVIWPEAAEVTRLELVAQLRATKLIAQGIPTSKPTPGTWCHEQYCSIRATCPETRKALEEIAPIPAIELGKLTADSIATPADVARAWPKLRLIEAAVKAVKDRCREIVVDQGGVPLNEKQELRLAERVVETFSKARVPKDRQDVIEELRSLGALAFSKSSYLKEMKR